MPGSQRPPSPADLKGSLTQLQNAATALKTAILRARGKVLTNPAPVSSPAADRWKNDWEAQTAAALNYLNTILSQAPEQVGQQIKGLQSQSPKAGAGVGGRGAAAGASGQVGSRPGQPPRG